ncbi:hypothetical protein BKA62DRAFT_765703 [Auriculariales sp. MPI-PUGE-AT-0066]|nr:hypothetical protein BKA62DRAFT_765703 [Auriculariales sp. MPI-PUGE-AT-0066]
MSNLRQSGQQRSQAHTGRMLHITSTSLLSYAVICINISWLVLPRAMDALRAFVLLTLLATSARGGPLTRKIFQSDVNFVLSFGDRHVYFLSYTSDGWNGKGDPLVKHGTACSVSGPTWPRQLTPLLPKPPKLFSGSTADASIIYAAPLDFVGQVQAFYDYVIPNATLVPWTPSDALFVIGFGTNDVNLSFYATITDQPNGATLHAKDFDSYFTTVERLYTAGARAFVFDANRAIRPGRNWSCFEYCSTSSTHIDDFVAQLEDRVIAYCASKTDLLTCTFFDLHGLIADIMDN